MERVFPLQIGWRMKSKYMLFVGVALGLILAATAASLFLQKPYTFKGSLIQPALPAADFTLMAGNGQPFHLAEQRGKVVLLFFGYTYCPDVCPVTLSEYKKIRAALGEKAPNVVFLFITVDPPRDTPEVLQKHVALFDPAIIGLTGTPAELQAVWDAYGVVREERPVSGAAGYLVDHTARIYLVDKGGNLRLTYPYGFEPEGIVQDVAHLLEE